MEDQVKVYVVMHTVSVYVEVAKGKEELVEADPKILGVYWNRDAAQDYVDQFLDERNTWDNYSIMERELVR